MSVHVRAIIEISSEEGKEFDEMDKVIKRNDKRKGEGSYESMMMMTLSIARTGMDGLGEGNNKNSRKLDHFHQSFESSLIDGKFPSQLNFLTPIESSNS